MFGDAECEICGDYAVVGVRHRMICGVCFGVFSVLLAKRSKPDLQDVREIFSCLYLWRGEPTPQELKGLLTLVDSSRSAAPAN